MLGFILWGSISLCRDPDFDAGVTETVDNSERSIEAGAQGRHFSTADVHMRDFVQICREMHWGRPMVGCLYWGPRCIAPQPLEQVRQVAVRLKICASEISRDDWRTPEGELCR